MTKSGFSLVELSIVLVVLGLLTGGILTGQNLIRSAELRKVTTEFQSYQTAVMSFKNRYFALPGDMSNATDFWGAATCPGTAGTGIQTCNGNANGDIEAPGGPSEYGERFTFWQHLANAGLLEGSYTGMSGSGSTHFHVRGVNAPASRLGNGTWSVHHWGTMTGDTGLFNGDYGNAMYLGVSGAGANASTPIMTAEEAWNIDKKIDDSRPATGKMVVRNRADCTNATAANDLDA